ncbi:hypothetical protein [Burkholderia sp. ABCPW 14]|uniref:hypothetical protein n=1 Tax=Burkholderia sp. ABCPW 14 TaxID=1637860 RepID=UPI001E4C812C|nr:hypothetical protein [Burkholderia sp. ABCPW 14]
MAVSKLKRFARVWPYPDSSAHSGSPSSQWIARSGMHFARSPTNRRAVMRIAACLAYRPHPIVTALAALFAVLSPFVVIAHENDTYRHVVTPPVHIAATEWIERFVHVDAGVFARQRERMAAPVPVATPTPLFDHSSAVTLWDEIGPPTPLPVPSDAQRMVQGNDASYTRR